MQRFPQQHATAEQSDIDVTPLLYVVFILLIFFIVTATFVQESGLEANRSKPDKVPEQLNQDQVILVRIEANNQIRIDNRLTDIRRVTAQIIRLHAAHPERTVVIEPSEESHTNTLVQIMDASRRANVPNYSLTNTF